MYRLILIFLFPFVVFCQPKFSKTGTWIGFAYPKGIKPEKGTALYIRFDNGAFTSRKQSIQLADFQTKSGKLEENKTQLHLAEEKLEKIGGSSRTKWCNFEYDLTYDSSTGYLKGTYSSTDCRNNSGEVILYRIDEKTELTESAADKSWVELFAKDLNKGLASKEMRQWERDNFKFEPIYFDFDKSEIREVHYAFLNNIVRVVQSHTDLRIKVIGHTDEIGSDGYNIGLSERRAESIILYFESKGLTRNQIVIDFKGERQPADSNKTPEGRQRNRRVDFQFI